MFRVCCQRLFCDTAEPDIDVRWLQIEHGQVRRHAPLPRTVQHRPGQGRLPDRSTSLQSRLLCSTIGTAVLLVRPGLPAMAVLCLMRISFPVQRFSALSNTSNRATTVDQLASGWRNQPVCQRSRLHYEKC